MLILNYVICYIIPICFSYLLCKNKNTNAVLWLLNIFFFGSYVATIFITCNWPYTFSYFSRYFILILFFISAFYSYFHIEKSFRFESPNFTQSIRLAPQAIISIIFICEIFFCIKGFINPGHSIDLDFPLKNASFYISQGGNSQLLNHHYSMPAQKYALDILQLNPLGFRSKNIIPKKLDDYNIFGSSIYSPCKGTVIQVANNYEDQEPGIMDTANPAGNYIAIKMEDTNAIELLA